MFASGDVPSQEVWLNITWISPPWPSNDQPVGEKGSIKQTVISSLYLCSISSFSCWWLLPVKNLRFLFREHLSERFLQHVDDKVPFQPRGWWSRWCFGGMGWWRTNQLRKTVIVMISFPAPHSHFLLKSHLIWHWCLRVAKLFLLGLSHTLLHPDLAMKNSPKWPYFRPENRGFTTGEA